MSIEQKTQRIQTGQGTIGLQENSPCHKKEKHNLDYIELEGSPETTTRRSTEQKSKILLSLKRDNYFSEDLMITRENKPPTKNNSPITNQELEKLLESVISKAGPRDRSTSLMSLLVDDDKHYFDHWNVKCCAGGEDIEGVLIINANTLTFTGMRNKEIKPKSMMLLNRRSKKFPFVVFEKSFGNFELVVDMRDIASCKISSFPMPCGKKIHHRDALHIIELILYTHGTYLDPELDKILLDLRSKKVPYACVYFNVRLESDPCGVTKESLDAILQIQTKIKAAMRSLKKRINQESETDLPYFEFPSENFLAENSNLLQKARQAIKKNMQTSLENFKNSIETIHKSLKADKMSSQETKASFEEDKSFSFKPIKKPRRIVIPATTDQSTIVNKDKLAQIISCVPDLFQSLEWKLLYATKQHGISYSNLMRKAGSASPFLIIIQDLKGNVFGAYGSDNLKFAKSYFGTAETFLFTFKNTDEIQEFKWSKKNNLYIFANEEGVMFGTGPFYGLWFDHELLRGRTHVCDTFDNQLLSDSTDFEIAKLEVRILIDLC